DGQIQVIRAGSLKANPGDPGFPQDVAQGGMALVRVSPCSGCETGHPSPPFALRSGDNLYVPRTP
ncbi:MAG: hypothetical protein, partial [Olavius algarvensis Gamma 1 endosymbiont]